ncbi:Protein of unknown function, partial [Gryllus bimaculatus]
MNTTVLTLSLRPPPLSLSRPSASQTFALAFISTSPVPSRLDVVTHPSIAIFPAAEPVFTAVGNAPRPCLASAG